MKIEIDIQIRSFSRNSSVERNKFLNKLYNTKSPLTKTSMYTSLNDDREENDKLNATTQTD